MAKRSQVPKVIPPVLPLELPAARRHVSLLDEVQRIIEQEYSDPDFHKMFSTVDTIDSKYGSKEFDKTMCAMHIWKKGSEDGSPIIAAATPHQIKTKLERAKIRYDNVPGSRRFDSSKPKAYISTRARFLQLLTDQSDRAE